MNEVRFGCRLQSKFPSTMISLRKFVLEFDVVEGETDMRKQSYERLLA